MTRRQITRAIAFYVLSSLIAIILVLPFFWMVSTSLKDRGALLILPVQWIPERISFAAYRTIFEIFPFGRAVGNSVFVSVATTFITITSASMAAFVFSKIEFRGRDTLFALYLATMMIPGQVTMIPNFLVLRYMGLLNSFTGLLLPSLFNAFGTFLLRQNMRQVPDAYLEAAVIDGASYLGLFWRVMVPLCKPVLATLSVITFMGAWNDYLWPLIILTDRSKMTLPVGLSLLSSQHHNQYNLLMAGGIISIIPILVVYFFTQKYFEKGLSMGGIKG